MPCFDIDDDDCNDNALGIGDDDDGGGVLHIMFCVCKCVNICKPFYNHIKTVNRCTIGYLDIFFTILIL